MSELYIDPIVFAAVEGKPLPLEHHAKMFAASLPDAHPVKRLLTGEAQWLGDNKNIFGFLRLFCEIHEDSLRRADDAGILRTMAPLDRTDIAEADASLGTFIPDDVLYRGRRYSLRTLLKNARDAVTIVTREFPPLRTVGLDALDRTFARLVRAIATAPPAPEPSGLPDFRLVQD